MSVSVLASRVGGGASAKGYLCCAGLNPEPRVGLAGPSAEGHAIGQGVLPAHSHRPSRRPERFRGLIGLIVEAPLWLFGGLTVWKSSNILYLVACVLNSSGQYGRVS